MTAGSFSTNPPAEVLARLGQLREALASLRNVEHLLSSVQIGPKVLHDVLPELEASASSWGSDASELLRYCEASGGDPNLLVGFEEFLRELFAEFSRELAEASRTMMTAKARLSLERGVRKMVPVAATALEHLELLVEATGARGVALSLRELLLSRPDIGSERPYLPVPISGETESLEVRLPARVALRALGGLLGQVDSGSGLSVESLGDRCRLTVVPALRGEMTAHFPILPSLPETSRVVAHALAHYDVTVSDDGRVLEIPLVG